SASGGVGGSTVSRVARSGSTCYSRSTAIEFGLPVAASIARLSRRAGRLRSERSLRVEIRTCGGPQFVAHRYTATICRLGFTQTVTPKRSPQYNPFAEALLGALNRSLVSQVPPPPGAECARWPGPPGIPPKASARSGGVKGGR